MDHFKTGLFWIKLNIIGGLIDIMNVELDREERLTIDNALENEIGRLQNEIKKNRTGSYVNQCNHQLAQAQKLKERLRNLWPD